MIILIRLVDYKEQVLDGIMTYGPLVIHVLTECFLKWIGLDWEHVPFSFAE